MQPDDPIIREFLAAALRGEPKVWPEAWDSVEAADSVARAAIYHGIAGLLVEKSEAQVAWPATLTNQLRQAAVAQAMWELRHRQLLLELLDALHQRGIPSLLMKGTAIAYDIYENPAARSRGDSDMLVAPEDAVAAKQLLSALAYRPLPAGGISAALALQQSWERALPDGGSHVIDLHWQVLNAPSLRSLLTFEECLPASRPLDRLGEHANTMDRVRFLIHTCLHRALQNNVPYSVDGVAYVDPGRLIWSHDIHLVAGSLSDEQWDELLELISVKGVAAPVLEALDAAHRDLGTATPKRICDQLRGSGDNERGHPYFMKSHALSRARRDLRAVPGWRAKLRYAASRLVTTEDFLKYKYPHLAKFPLPILYGRRVIDMLWRRRDGARF